MSESKPSDRSQPSRRQPPNTGDGQAGRAHHPPGHPASGRDRRPLRPPVVRPRLRAEREAAALLARNFRQRQRAIDTARLGCVARGLASQVRPLIRAWLCLRNACTRGAHLSRAARLTAWQRVDQGMIALAAAMDWARRLQSANPPSIRKIITVTGRDYVSVDDWQPVHPATNSWGPIN